MTGNSKDTSIGEELHCSARYGEYSKGCVRDFSRDLSSVYSEEGFTVVATHKRGYTYCGFTSGGVCGEGRIYICGIYVRGYMCPRGIGDEVYVRGYMLCG